MNRCVVIGCGWAGMHHLRSIVKSEYATLVAAVEPDYQKQDIIGREYKIPVYPSLEALLATGIPFETGVVATLPDLHLVPCRTLIERGKSVLCEKPICRESKEIKELKIAAEVMGVRFGVVFNQRYGTAVQQAKRLLEEEDGALHLITASMFQHWPTKISGHVKDTFMITDACCHLLDLMTYLCGPVAEAKGIGVKNQSELYSDVVAVLCFQNGCVGTMSHTNVGGKRDTQHPFQCVDLHTGNARYRIENQFDRVTVYPHEHMVQRVYETSVFARRDYALSMRLACEDYLRAAALGLQIPASIDDALLNIQVLENILFSIQNN